MTETAENIRQCFADWDRQLIAAGMGQNPQPQAVADRLQEALCADLRTLDLDPTLLEVREGTMAGLVVAMKILVQSNTDLRLLRHFVATAECFLPLLERAPVELDGDLIEALGELTPPPEPTAPVPMCAACGQRPATGPFPGAPPGVLFCDPCIAVGLRSMTEQVRQFMGLGQSPMRPQMGGPDFNRGSDLPQAQPVEAPPAATGLAAVFSAVRQAIRRKEQ